MPSKKYIVLLAFLVVIGGVVALTWVGDTDKPNVQNPSDNETYGLNGSGYTTADLPRGVTVDGIVPGPLVDEHESKLDQSTYTMTVTSKETANGDTREVRTVYTKGESSARIVQSADGQPVQEKFFDLENGTMYLCDRTKNEECPTDVIGERAFSAETENIRALFQSGTWIPTDVDENAPYTAVSLKTSNLENESRLTESFRISNTTEFEGRATVDSRQVITNVNISVVGEMQDRPSNLSYRATVTAVNQTTVEKPSWVTEEAETPRESSGMQNDGHTMFVTNTENSPYVAGSEVRVSIEGENTYRTVTTTLEEDLAVGETLYLTLIDGSVNVNKNEAPDRRGEELTARAYVVELVPAGGDSATTTEEIPGQQ